MRPPILSYFKGEPRRQQREILEAIEKDWDRYDVFVVSAPVATGKSLCIHAIGNYAKDAVILTPTNILIDQYRRDFDDIAYLQKQSMYEFVSYYRRAKYEFLQADLACCNYYMYLSMKTHCSKEFRPKTLIVDEAHQLIPMLTELDAKKIWRYKYPYPNNLYTEADLINWLEDTGLAAKKEFRDIMMSYKSSEPSYVFERTTDLWRGQERELIKVKPVTIKNRQRTTMWPWHVQKIVLMSATISSTDIEELGLDRKRVRYIDVDSPIPASSRPIIYDPVGSMSHTNQDAMLDKVVDYIEDKLSQFNTKGIIHLTYGLSRKLQKRLDNKRLIWHSNTDKHSKYAEFLESKESMVLMACGLTEGIDLVDDAGRWQVILKLPYPSLVDNAISYKAENNQDWYSWVTIKEILQASGRICRHQRDLGITYIADSGFERLYRPNKDKFPEWFRSALEWSI